MLNAIEFSHFWAHSVFNNNLINKILLITLALSNEGQSDSFLLKDHSNLSLARTVITLLSRHSYFTLALNKVKAVDELLCETVSLVAIEAKNCNWVATTLFRNHGLEMAVPQVAVVAVKQWTRSGGDCCQCGSGS